MVLKFETGERTVLFGGVERSVAVGSTLIYDASAPSGGGPGGSNTVGAAAAVTDGTSVYVYDDTGTLLHTLTPGSTVHAVGADGDHLYVGADDAVQAYTLDGAWTPVWASPPAPPAPMQRLRPHPLGLFASMHSKNSPAAVVYDLADGSTVLTVATAHDFWPWDSALSADGTVYASAGLASENRQRVIEVGTGTVLYDGTDSKGTGVAFMPNGDVLFAGDFGWARVDPATGNVTASGGASPTNVATIRAAASGSIYATVNRHWLGSYSLWAGPPGGPEDFALPDVPANREACELSSDDSRVIAGGDADGNIAEVYDTATGALLFAIPGSASLDRGDATVFPQGGS
jgi:WD40 repeat protein